MKSFIVLRVKSTGLSVHRVYVKSKQEAFELRWFDESKVIGKFVLPVA